MICNGWEPEAKVGLETPKYVKLWCGWNPIKVWIVENGWGNVTSHPQILYMVRLLIGKARNLSGLKWRYFVGWNGYTDGPTASLAVKNEPLTLCDQFLFMSHDYYLF